MINLLPLEEKKNLEMEEEWRLTLLLGILILIFFVCLILILYSIKIYITVNAESQKFAMETKSKEFEKTETKALKEEISVANKNFIKLNDFYQEPIYLTDIFEKVSNTLSPGMYLDDLSYQKRVSGHEENFEIILSGFAPNTDVLFDFRKNIEKVFSTKVDVGDSWIKPTDFKFIFQIKVER